MKGNPGLEHSDRVGSGAGHPIILFPGWVTNDARYSVQPDIQPLKIAPVHFTDWTGRQIQLSNGWQYTNYGKRDPSDGYRRMLYSSASGPGLPKPRVLKGGQQQPQAYPAPSQLQIQRDVFSRSAPDPNQSGSTGVLAPGVSLKGRTYFG